MKKPFNPTYHSFESQIRILTEELKAIRAKLADSEKQNRALENALADCLRTLRLLTARFEELSQSKAFLTQEEAQKLRKEIREFNRTRRALLELQKP